MRVDCWQRYWKLSLTYMLNISFLNIYPTYMFCFLITYIWIFIILGGIFNEATTLLACVLCVWGVSCLGWPPNYKHSVLPDRERLWLWVCMWSTSSLLLFFAVIGKDSVSLPVSHNALLPLSGCARGRALLGCEILPYLLLLYLLSLCIV